MPRITLSIKDTDETVMRPIMFEIIRDILNKTNLEANTNILFPGNNVVAYQPGTTLSDKNENREKNRFSHSKRVFIEVDEDYDDAGAVTAAIMKPENRFIYVDEALGCYLKPAYSTMEATINFRYRAKDRVEALRWRDHVRTKISMGRETLLHSPTYFYLIPDSVFTILEEIHRLRENVDGYGETFQEYIGNNFTQRMTVVSTQAGTGGRAAITETQRRVVGRFDFSTKPERAERDGEGEAWVISFSYRLTYEKPISLVMLYPLVVHNQLLSVKFRASKPTDRDEFHELSHTMSTSGFRPFEPDYMIDKWKATRGISIPDFDDFIPSQILPRTIRVLTGLLLINENTTTLMNFHELGDWKLEDDILEFMVGEAPYMTKMYHSVLCVSLYRNHDLVDESLETISVDEQLNVNLNTRLSLRDYYHIRLSINTDLESLTKDALDRLRQKSKVFEKIIKAIYPNINLDLSRIDTNGPVTRDELDKVIRDISKNPLRGDLSNRIGYNTVQGFFIRVRHNSEVA